jgi:hypothetical protein
VHITERDQSPVDVDRQHERRSRAERRQVDVAEVLRRL